MGLARVGEKGVHFPSIKNIGGRREIDPQLGGGEKEYFARGFEAEWARDGGRLKSGGLAIYRA
jgi:hypothetical protein